MAETLLPLFPLEAVLLPTNLLPLHIFEDRYKELILDVLKTESEFGVVQAGSKGILNLGCTASVEKIVHRYPDGRLDILTVGRRRFEVLFLDEEKSYLRGAVSFYADEDVTPPGKDVAEMALACFELQRQQEGAEGERETPAQDDPQLSFKIAEHILDLNFRQTLLALRSETERLTHLNRFFPEYLARLKRTAHVRKVAPTNGHGMISLGNKSD